MGIRHLKKNVAENRFIFPMEMYTSLPGSIIVTAYILAEEKPDTLAIRKRWKKLLRHGLGFDLTDPDYIKKVCELFDIPMFDVNFAAFVFSDYNALVCPYVNGRIFPLREDGWYSRTLRKGIAYPLTDNEELAKAFEDKINGKDNAKHLGQPAN